MNPANGVTGLTDGVMLRDGLRNIEFTIHGTPIGKPRMTRSDKWRKRDCVVKYRNWADDARAQIARQGIVLPSPSEVIALSWVATFAPPRSWSAKKTTEHLGSFHRAKPDRDNIDKCLLDVLFDEDSGVAAGTLVKVWGNVPSLFVVISCLKPELASNLQTKPQTKRPKRPPGNPVAT